jgi:hypothetical protein
MSDYIQRNIRFKAGMNPTPDSTEQNTVHIIDGNNVRFASQNVEKVGGWVSASLDFKDIQNNTLSITQLSGTPRSIITFEKSNNTWEVIGTSSHLYAKLGSSVYNITPLKTTSTTLATDPLEFTSGDKTMTVNFTAHGLAVGDRFKISGATHGTGGFATTNINKEHIVATVVDANEITVEMGNNAPTTDATEGGAAVLVYKQIDAGGTIAAAATGAWIGAPFVGVPWASGTDTSLVVQPRIWWADMFGDTLICGAGSQGKCYYWTADFATAPAIISNAPNADWGWIEDAKLVILSGNTVANSNVGDYNDWTIAVGSYAYSDAKEDANKLIGRAYVNGENIVFADENKMFRLKWVGGAVKWQWSQVSSNIGTVSPLGYVVAGGVLFIFGRQNVYYYNGGLLQPLPNNTLKNYVFDDINLDQRYKVFVWYNAKFEEIWAHYPSGDSTENDRVFIYSTTEGHYTKIDNLARTAADRKGQVLNYPLLASPSSGLFQHEYGYNNNGAALNAWFQTSYTADSNGKYITEVYGVEPDMIQTGSVDFELYAKERASDDTPTMLQSKSVGESDGTADFLQDVRWRSWIIRSNVVNGFFRTGSTKEFIARGGQY